MSNQRSYAPPRRHGTDAAPEWRAPGRSGKALPPSLRHSVERLSGVSLDGVTVHRNSAEAERIGTLAFARGTQIHLAPGQDRHLPHEAWHVVQQRQGRVGIDGATQDLEQPANEDPRLEAEADWMGGLAAQQVAPMPDETPAQQAQPSTPAASAPAVLQPMRADKRWKNARIRGKTAYYWDDDTPHDGLPPPGAEIVPRPTFTAMKDERKAGSGGSMKSLRANKDTEWDDFEGLMHQGWSEATESGMHYSGETEKVMIPGGLPVRASIPKRDPGIHRTLFSRETGEPSATKYADREGAKAPGTKYNILHMAGHGETGTDSQDPRNLVAASEGANSEMIPYDDLLGGDTSVQVQTYGEVRKGTKVGERVHQVFVHEDDPETPFFHKVIDGHRPKPSRSEYDEWERDAKRKVGQDKRDRAAAVRMRLLSKSSPKPPDEMSEEDVATMLHSMRSRSTDDRRHGGGPVRNRHKRRNSNLYHPYKRPKDGQK